MGGHSVLSLAQRQEFPATAIAAFHAARNGNFAQSKARFLFHFAEDAAWVSVASVKKLKKSREVAGSDASYHVDPKTTPWFFESDRANAFNSDAAALSWKRTVSFLRDELTNQSSGRAKARPLVSNVRRTAMSKRAL